MPAWDKIKIIEFFFEKCMIFGFSANSMSNIMQKLDKPSRNHHSIMIRSLMFFLSFGMFYDLPNLLTNNS